MSINVLISMFSFSFQNNNNKKRKRMLINIFLRWRFVAVLYTFYVSRNWMIFQVTYSISNVLKKNKFFSINIMQIF